MHNRKEHPDLLGPTRDLLEATGLPYVIENVEGAPMRNYVTLCGTAFGLATAGAELWRHRRFESNMEWPLGTPQCAHGQRRRVIGVYGGHGRDRRRRFNGQDFPTDDRRNVMGIEWMSGEELSQAIPPAYTEWVGTQLLRHHLELAPIQEKP
jgi:DNA (cytosine-5)-methyltransferase 1